MKAGKKLSGKKAKPGSLDDDPFDLRSLEAASPPSTQDASDSSAEDLLGLNEPAPQPAVAQEASKYAADFQQLSNGMKAQKAWREVRTGVAIGKKRKRETDEPASEASSSAASTSQNAEDLEPPSKKSKTTKGVKALTKVWEERIQNNSIPPKVSGKAK